MLIGGMTGLKLSLRVEVTNLKSFRYLLKSLADIITLIKFESGSNQFKEFSLPSQIIGGYHYILVDLKDRLTMMVYSPYGGPLVNVFHLDEDMPYSLYFYSIKDRRVAIF